MDRDHKTGASVLSSTEGRLGQNDARLEQRSEDNLKHFGTGSKQPEQDRRPPKLGQKEAEEEASSEAALKDLSRKSAR